MISLDPSRTKSYVGSPRSTTKAEVKRAADGTRFLAPSERSDLSGLPSRIASVAPSEVAKVVQSIEGTEFVPGELIVKLVPGQDVGLMGTFAEEYGAEIVEHFDMPESMFKSFGGDLIRLKLPQGIELAEAIAAMKDDQRVVYAEGNEVIRLEDEAVAPESTPSHLKDSEVQGAPNDLDSRLWGLHNVGQDGGKEGADIHALEAWKVTKGDKSLRGPLIAIIDTGIDYHHPDLKANLFVNAGEIAGDGIDNDGNGVIDDVYGYNAYANTGNPLDGHSHGTHCAGTIGAVGDNGIGVTGVMQDARLMAVKIFDDSGSTSTDAIVRGLSYAAKMGADITSNSWGGGARSEAIFDAFKANPALHIIAAGNSGYDNDKRDAYPANYELDHIVAVAASTRRDEKASFSQYGAKSVDVAAPGAQILSTVPGGGYGVKSGTSMATPHVSGVAGLIMSAYPEASNAEIKERLIQGSDPVPALEGLTVSQGRINAARSLQPNLLKG